MMGRPTKPLETKILTGTFREDRHGPADGAVKTEGVPAKPDYLDGHAGELWDAHVPGLVASKVAGERDAPALVAMCEWWGRYRKISESLDKLKNMATRTARVLSIQAAEAFKCFSAIACRFGLTPADRTRLKIEPVKQSGVASRKRA